MWMFLLGFAVPIVAALVFYFAFVWNWGFGTFRE